MLQVTLEIFVSRGNYLAWEMPCFSRCAWSPWSPDRHRSHSAGRQAALAREKVSRSRTRLPALEGGATFVTPTPRHRRSTKCLQDQTKPCRTQQREPYASPSSITDGVGPLCRPSFCRRSRMKKSEKGPGGGPCRIRVGGLDEMWSPKVDGNWQTPLVQMADGAHVGVACMTRRRRGPCKAGRYLKVGGMECKARRSSPVRQ